MRRILVAVTKHQACAAGVTLILLLTASCFAQQRAIDLDDVSLQLLTRHGQQMSRTSHGWILDLSDRAHCRANLLEVRDALLLERRIIEENIRSANTTNAENGQPYREQRVIVSESGLAQVVSLPWRYVYDPNNPNAYSRGPHRGYVPLSKIDVAAQQRRGDDVTRALREVEGLLKQIGVTPTG